MTRLFLMRHAEARPGPNQASGGLFSTGDQPLSKEGRRQAAEMGELIARSDPGIDAVHASPAIRCLETAEIIAEHLPGDHTVVEHEDLVEVPYARPGSDYDEILDTILETTIELRDDPDPELPTGVSWQEATGRFTDELEAVVEQDDTPLVVAHGAQNRSWLAGLLGMDPHRMFALEQDHAALNVVAFSGGRPVVQKLNVTPDPLASEGASMEQ